MKVLKYLVLALAGVAVLAALIAFALPRTYKVERSIVIKAPMIKIFPQVIDPKGWQRWGVWNRRDPGMEITFSGAPAGPGAKWAWKSKSEGNGQMEITLADFDKRVGYRITFADFDMVAEGRLDFAPEADGVRVVWTGEGDVGGNPYMRYFAVMMDRMVGPDFEASLKNLKELAERPQ